MVSTQSSTAGRLLDFAGVGEGGSGVRWIPGFCAAEQRN